MSAATPERGGNRLFLTIHGFPLTAEGGTDTFKHIGAIAGVANAIPHRARHSFATWCLTVHPGDEIGLRRIIGHASVEVTSDYVHLAQSTIAARVGRSSLVQSLSAPKPVMRRQSDTHEPICNGLGKPPA